MMVASFPAGETTVSFAGGIPLRKERLLRWQLDDPSSQTGAGQEGGDVDSGLFKFNH
ncbi:MAG: hypothetical protein ABR905_12955 [Terracidiphilus sp.]